MTRVRRASQATRSSARGGGDALERHSNPSRGCGNATHEAGSNQAARPTQGLAELTLRAIGMSLPPDEDWVDITYKVDGTTHETRVPCWDLRVRRRGHRPRTLPPLPTGSARAPHQLGIDLRTC